LDTDLKIILLNHKNNYEGHLNVDDNVAKSFKILLTSLNVLHNYFDFSKFRSVSKLNF